MEVLSLPTAACSQTFQLLLGEVHDCNDWRVCCGTISNVRLLHVHVHRFTMKPLVSLMQLSLFILPLIKVQSIQLHSKINSVAYGIQIIRMLRHSLRIT